MSEIVIDFRPAISDDFESMALVLDRATAHRDALPPPEQLEDYQAINHVRTRMSRIAAHAIVATQDERIVGFAVSHPLVDQVPVRPAVVDTEHLSLLMIDPDYWGKRVASRLLDLTIDRARTIGMQYITLWTRKTDNSRAHAVYQHKGFARTGLIKPTDDGMALHYRLKL